MHLYINHLIGGLCWLNNEFLGTGGGENPKTITPGEKPKRWRKRCSEISDEILAGLGLEEKLGNETKYKYVV